MERIKLSKPNKLVGYRKPTGFEAEFIYKCLKEQLSQNRKIMGFAGYVVTPFAALLTLGVITLYRSTVETVIGGIIALVLWISLIALYKSMKTNEKFQADLFYDKFEVMDVVSYRHNYCQEEGMTMGSIMVQTNNGEILGHYVVDIKTALDCEKGIRENIPLLLVYDRETNESRVVSENMINDYLEKIH